TVWLTRMLTTAGDADLTSGARLGRASSGRAACAVAARETRKAAPSTSAARNRPIGELTGDIIVLILRNKASNPSAIMHGPSAVNNTRGGQCTSSRNSRIAPPASTPMQGGALWSHYGSDCRLEPSLQAASTVIRRAWTCG